MNNLFTQSDVSAIVHRINKLTPASERHWGKMNVAQMLAHCNESMETAIGEKPIKPVGGIGRFIGGLLRKGALGEKPFGKNSPTDKSYIFPADVNFQEQKQKVLNSVQRFHENGPSKCTRDGHAFFGKFTPEQWAVFQWKHLDHHLRQFGV